MGAEVFDCPHSTPKLTTKGPFVVRTQDIDSGTFRSENAAHVSVETYRERVARAEPRYGDILYSREGAYYGVAAEVPADTLLCLGQRMVLIRPPADVVDHRFLKYWMNSPGGRAFAESHREGSAAPRINLPTIRSFPIPLPSIEEQHAIATTLGALDRKIESNRRVIALAEGLARAHFSRLFQIDEIDSGVPLSTLVRINPRRILPTGEASTYVGMSSLPEFSAEVYEWEQKPAGSGQRFTNGDVVMARITPCLENGKTAVIDMLRSGEIGWGSTEYVVLAPRDHIITPWIYCLVRDDRVREFAIRSMNGTSGRQRFQASRFDEYRIAPPTAEALNEFNNIATPLFTRMTQMRDEAKMLSAVRDALLPELFSGRIRVPEAAEAIA
ncbi:restriction endonuclease subunit S [Mycobacteroides abscessus]|uniref:restriction endonuclease subunit S n=1 Tax=Mycobacteroides abscessus TaxID=36809 RepID=UPI000C25B75C|nr:restriction endonuclease subunit S [Mycobacteroides abscessus]